MRMTPEEKKQAFKKDLEELLKKYKASLAIETFGLGFFTDENIVVDFEYDESLYEENETGITPQLILGKYFD